MDLYLITCPLIVLCDWLPLLCYLGNMPRYDDEFMLLFDQENVYQKHVGFSTKIRDIIL